MPPRRSEPATFRLGTSDILQHQSDLAIFKSECPRADSNRLPNLKIVGSNLRGDTLIYKSIVKRNRLAPVFINQIDEPIGFLFGLVLYLLAAEQRNNSRNNGILY